MSSDDEAVTKKPIGKKKPVVVDSDDDDVPVVVKKAPKKPVAADSDDEDEVVMKKPAAKKAAVKDDSDDECVVAKPAGKKPVRADSDTDDEPTVRRPAHVDPVSAALDDDSDDDTLGSATPAELVDLIDYDNMSEDQFVAHLKAQTKAQRLEEKRRVAERKELQEDDDADEDKHFDGTPAYSYQFMLDRVLDICHRNNPELAKTERIRLPLPKIERVGSKRTAYINFNDTCLALNRTQKELKDYIEKTLTVQSSIDVNNCLILKYQGAKVSQFEKLIGKYVEEYVKCRACGRINTRLNRDSSSRLLLMNCKDCGANRYIQVAGGATFKAQTTKRSRQRNNAMT